MTNYPEKSDSSIGATPVRVAGKRLLATLAVFTLVACSPDPQAEGEAGAGSVAGLEMATTMSVVTPVSESTGGGAQAALSSTGPQQNYQVIQQIISGQVFPVDSDFFKDKTSVYVDNDTQEAMGVINFVLCLMGQTAIGEMVNKGPYVAIVGFTSCVESAFGGDSNEGEQLLRVVVNSSRAFDNSPQYVRIWLPLAENDPDAASQGVTGGALLQATIFEEPNETYPFGRFTLSFSVEVDDPNGDSDFNVPENLGTLKTILTPDGKTEFRFAFEAGDPLLLNDDYSLQSVDALMDDSTGTSGKAKTFWQDIRYNDGTMMWEVDQQSFEVAYNDTLFYKKETGLGVPDDIECFDRSAPYRNVWNYRLYHEQNGMFRGKPVKSGQRVDLTRYIYFDFNYAGNEHYGSMGDGYFWANMPDDMNGDKIPFPDQQVVQSTDWETDITTDYVIHVSDGEARYEEGRSVLISALVGQNLRYYGRDNTGNYASSYGYDHWLVQVNPGTNDFEITGGRTWNPVTYEYDVTPVGPIVVNRPFDSTGAVTAWKLDVSSDTFGNLSYQHNPLLPPALRAAAYVIYKNVMPYEPGLAGGVLLHCYENCPIGGTVTDGNEHYPAFEAPIASLATNPTVTYDGSATDLTDLPAADGGARTYILQSINNGTKYQLIDNTNGQAVTGDGSTANYIGSGNMVPLPLVDVWHPARNSTGLQRYWEARYVDPGDSNFSWSYGQEDWYRAHTATESTAAGPVVVFDEPIYIPHQHALIEDRNRALGLAQVDQYDGQIFALQFDNWLSGLPDHEIPYTSNPRTVRSVNFVNRVRMVDVDGNAFVIKAREVSEVMLPFTKDDGMGGLIPDTDPCTVGDPLTLGDIGTLQLPDATFLEEMNFSFADIPISALDPPRVVQGEVL